MLFVLCPYCCGFLTVRGGEIRNRFKFHLNIRLSAIFQAFCGPAFQLLSREKGMIEHPDTIDDLFRLCGR